MIKDVSDRKRNDDSRESEESGERNSERRKLSPPNTSTLYSPPTLSTLFTLTTLNPTQFPIIYSLQNTILSTSFQHLLEVLLLFIFVLHIVILLFPLFDF